MVFQSGANWCAALSDTGLCDCSKQNDCTIDEVEQKITYADFNLISMQNLKFGRDSVAVFDGFRGLAIGHAGSLVFSDGRQQLKLILSNMGRVRVCAIGVETGGYKLC
ncbi:MAG: prepilin peptidase dependent protein A [Paraglaciecola sp.]|nr:prepilin peptidase dependent protein A [Paraglaciecola sp.]